MNEGAVSHQKARQRPEGSEFVVRNPGPTGDRLFLSRGAQAPDRSFAEHQIKEKTRIGEYGRHENPGKARSWRVARQHDAQRYCKDDEGLNEEGDKAPEREMRKG